jgi:hypothetical protein
MSALAKPSRRKDRKLLTGVKSHPCTACGSRREVDPAHVRGRGAGGGDEEWNVMPLCRLHHMEQTAMGWDRFAERHPLIWLWLVKAGWGFEGGKLRRVPKGGGER